jgi:DNA repair exonuclease SbcCD ATPase subunit
LENALINKGFSEFGKDNDNDDEIIYYFGHDDWDVNDDREYFNRLNVKYDLTDLSIEIDLEDGFSKIEDYTAAKKEIQEKKEEIEEIDRQISNLEDKKRDLEGDIEDLENDLSSDLYY